MDAQAMLLLLLAVTNADWNRRGRRPVLDPRLAHGAVRKAAQLGGGGGGGGGGACSSSSLVLCLFSVGRVRATNCWAVGNGSVAVVDCAE
jgi:hypothetical protein